MTTNSEAGWWKTSSGVPDLLDTALVHDHDPVGDFEGLFLIVGYEDAGDLDPAMEGPQPAAKFLANLGIQRSERLVQQQHAGLDGERAGQGDTLALSAGKLGRIVARPADELNQFEQFIDFAAQCRLGQAQFPRTYAKPKATFSKTVMWRKSA